MNLNIENLVRSGVVLVVGLPLVIGVSGTLGSLSRSIGDAVQDDERTEIVNTMKTDLTRDCLNWAFSKADTKLERTAKNAIDDYVGGEVNYSEVCKWVLG